MLSVFAVARRLGGIAPPLFLPNPGPMSCPDGRGAEA